MLKLSVTRNHFLCSFTKLSYCTLCIVRVMENNFTCNLLSDSIFTDGRFYAYKVYTVYSVLVELFHFAITFVNFAISSSLPSSSFFSINSDK